MSSDGESILMMVEQVRKFCEEVSLLLRTIDDQMDSSDWNSFASASISDSSLSIANPAQWIPICIFRFYVHKEYPKIHPGHLAFVSVLLDDEWDRKYTIKEPLITAGYFDYGKAEVGDNYDYRYSRCYGYLYKNNDLKQDGTPFKFDRKMLPPEVVGKPKQLFERGEVFAFPLTSMKNADDAGRVAHKLVDLLKQSN